MKYKLKNLFLIVFLCWNMPLAFSQVTITLSPAGTKQICEGVYTDVGTIEIQEGNDDDFPVNTLSTIILNMPANFELEAGVGTITFDAGQDITILSSSIETDKITINLQTDDTGNKTDKVSISGIKVKANAVVTGEDMVSDASNTILGLNSNEVIMTFDGIATPVAPTISSVSYPQGTDLSLTTIMATVVAGNTVNWYDDASLSTALSGSNTETINLTGVNNLNINSAFVGTNTFYVTQTNPEGCESPATSFTITITPLPVVITLSPMGTKSICQDIYTDVGTIEIEEGSNNNFSESTVSTIILNMPANFELEAGVGTVTFDAGQDITILSSSIETDKITINLQTDATADAKDKITISGIKVKANAVVTGEDMVSDASNTILGLNSNEVIMTFDGVVRPSAPTIGSSTYFYCKEQDLTPESITVTGEAGNTYNWYSDADLTMDLGEISNTISLTGPISLNINSSSVSSSTFYVTQTNSSGCESTATSFTIDVQESPVVFISSSKTPDVSNTITICDNETVTFTALGNAGQYRFELINSSNVTIHDLFVFSSSEEYTIPNPLYPATTLVNGESYTVKVTGLDIVTFCETTSEVITINVNNITDLDILDIDFNILSDADTTNISSNEGQFTLNSNPSNATFSGTGVIFDGFNYFFDPGGLTEGVYQVNCSYISCDQTLKDSTYFRVTIPSGALTMIPDKNEFCTIESNPEFVINQSYWIDAYDVGFIPWLDAEPVHSIDNNVDDWWISQVIDVNTNTLLYDIPSFEQDFNPYGLPGTNAFGWTNGIGSSDLVPSGGTEIITRIEDREELDDNTGCATGFSKQKAKEPRYELNLSNITGTGPLGIGARTLRFTVHARFKRNDICNDAFSNTFTWPPTDEYDDYWWHTITVYPTPNISFDLPAGISEYCKTSDNDFFVQLSNIQINSAIPTLPSTSSEYSVIFEYRDTVTDIITPLPGSGGSDLGRIYINQIPAGNYDIIMRFVRNIPSSSETCESIVSQNITIKNSPLDSDYTYINQCLNSNIEFTANDASATSTWTYQWNFGDGFTSPELTGVTDIVHSYNAPGEYDVTLEVTNDEGCKKVITKEDIKILPIPVADFSFAKACQGSVTEFTDLSKLVDNNGAISILDEIEEWRWNFGDGTTVTITDPALASTTHEYINIGRYIVTLEIITKGDDATGAFCSNMIEKEVIIFPQVMVATEIPYYEDFEGDSGGWNHRLDLESSASSSSWEYGTSTEIPDATDNNIWATSLSGSYQNNEISYLETPCIDLTSIDKPMMIFRYWYNLAEGDTLAVLVSYDDGQSWGKFGEEGEGVNWYNNTSTDNWSNGTIPTWQIARIGLDEVKNNSVGSTVRFRFALGTDPSIVRAGFALDDFQIISRNKNVLLQHFTNQEDENFASILEAIDNFNPSIEDGIIKLQYHTEPIPDNDDYANQVTPTDPINQDNPTDPSARALHYGIGNTPKSVLNDIVLEETLINTAAVDSAISEYSRRILFLTPLSIEANFPDSGSDSLSIETTITALDTTLKNGNPLVIHTIIIEREVSGAIDGVPIIKNVVKKMLPDATGTYIDRNWEVGDTEVVSNNILLYEGEINNLLATRVYDANQVAVVVYVEDYITKEIYQSGLFIPSTSDFNLTTSLENEIDTKLWVYPNPANNQVYVGFEKTVEQDYHWKMLSTIGQEIAKGILEKGKNGFYINTNSLAEGMYIVELSNRKNKITKKFVVKH